MKEVLVIIGGVLFLSSSVFYVFVKVAMKPRQDDLPSFHEFEERDPRLFRYERYSRLAIAGAVVGALLLFIGAT